MSWTFDEDVEVSVVVALISEGPPAKFSIGLMEGPCRIGVPFSIPLQLRDIFNHLCKPDMSLIPEVKAKWVDVDGINDLWQKSKWNLITQFGKSQAVSQVAELQELIVRDDYAMCQYICNFWTSSKTGHVIWCWARILVGFVNVTDQCLWCQWVT